jgi:hypothetical protein
VLAVVPAHAGKIVTESSKDGRQNIETLEFNAKGQLRVTSNGLDSMGLIVRDNRPYFFGELKGKPAVVDMLAALKKLTDQGMKRPESDPAVEEIADIKPAGRKQTVAGIEGEVHAVTWTLAGKKRTEEIVLTRDPRLTAVIRSLSLDPGLMNNMPRKASLKEEVYARGYFLLKSQNSAVTAVDFSPAPDERFALKATPVDNVDTIMEIVMATAFGAVGAAVGAAGSAVGQAMGETAAKPEPRAEPVEPTVSAAGETPLHDAARDGDVAKVTTLLAKGTDVNARNKIRNTPLHVAAFRGEKGIAELLLAKGADLNARNNEADTPLHLAALKGEQEVAELLLAKGANLNAKDDDGDTPLHLAAGEGKKDIAGLLLAKGADVNAKRNDGDTPLQVAVRKGKEDFAELLKKHNSRRAQ